LERQTNQAANAAAQRREGSRRQIEEEFSASGLAAPVERALTEAAGAIAVEAYQSALAPVISRRGAMFAVGGFARGDLFPYSGVDILIVFEGEAPFPGFQEAVSRFIQRLWENGVRPRQRVTAIDACLELREQNFAHTINLLDRRFLAGDEEIGAQLESKFREFLGRHGRSLAQRLCELTRARHAKYQNTPYHSEPDIKDAPGGLRDLRLAGRLAKLCAEPVRADDPLDAAAAFLASVRCFLHYRAHDDRNLLDAAAQQAIREQPFCGSATSSAWMREYFRNARAIFNEARRAMEPFETPPPAASAGFSNPATVFGLLESIAGNGIPPAAETERRLEGAKDGLAAFCAQPRPLWSALKTILSLPHAATALRVLRDAGLMPAVFPEWAGIEGLIAPDADHRFTVDEHTLMTMEQVRELRETTDSARQRFSDVLSEVEDQAVLLFALLFHEAGKSAAREAGVRIQMPASERETVEFLIEHQLDLSEIVSGRDLDDPATARLLATSVGTIERLRLLSVLTYADIAAAQPGTMTSWRLEQLGRTYDVTQHELTCELETDRIQELPESLPAQAEFIRGFPVRYLRARPASEIERHTQLYETSRATGVALQLDRTEGAYRLTVVARDMPFLFASFAGAISSFGLDILKAEAFSNSEGVILDTFVFADPKRTLELNPPEVERLEDLIRRVATGKTDARRLLRNQAQPDPRNRSIAPHVQFDSEACETATLVEIVTEDRRGLLYSLATVFSSSGCNIDIVLIDTTGRRAIDVFYVAHGGGKLTPEFQATLKEKLLAAC
jgi:[protein-PII] uridylyltransferase